MPRRIRYLLWTLPVLALCAAGIFWYWWKNPKAAAGFTAPEGSELLAVVNSHRFIEDALRYGVSIKGDSGVLRRKLSESGISLHEPFWVFASQSRGFAGVAVKISDAGKLSMFMTETLGAAAVKGKPGRWTSKQFSAEIRGPLLYLCTGDSMPQPRSAEDAAMPWLQSSLGDTLCRGVIYAGAPALKAFYGADNTDLRFSAWGENNILQLIFSRPLPMGGSLDTSAALDLQLPQSALRLFPHIRKDLLKAVRSQGLDTAGVWAGNGHLAFRLGAGSRVVKNRIVTYGYDEEFNRVEKVSWMSKSLPDLAAEWSTAAGHWYDATKSDSATSGYRSLNMFGWPVRVFRENGLLRLMTAGEGPAANGKNASLNGHLWLSSNRLLAALRRARIPGKWPENLHLKMLTWQNGSVMQAEFDANPGKPAWMLLLEDLKKF